MTDIAKTDVGELSLMDGFLIGASKLATEGLMSNLPIVGGTSYMSGFSKIAVAAAMSMVSKNKWVRIVQTGILLDGVEDVVVVAKAQFFGKNNDSASSSDVGTAAFSSAFAA